MENGYENELIYLNTPILEQDEDIIGVQTYVDKLNAAIDAHAQMIAITSPFGAGKTSVIELLEKKRTLRKKSKDKKVRQVAKKERVVKISMWSQLHNCKTVDAPVDLHRTFVYQLASKIAPWKGTYISRRLSKDYGLLKLHTNRRFYWPLTLLAICLLIFSWAINTFSTDLNSIFPQLEKNLSAITIGTILIASIVGLIILTRADIIFSSKKSEGERNIDIDEILDLYQMEILRYRWLHKKHFIVIIEDLDRTKDRVGAIRFLKELRRYCVISSDNKLHKRHRNCVTFIVNIMPEAKLSEETKEALDTESLYAKLFDFVLNLQTINIDNYNAILEGLLNKKEKLIRELGVCTETQLMKIGGIQWIAREPKIGIREIKERLNMAFTLFQSLQKKFPNSEISFEKCAVVAYLTTAFEADFYKTNDRGFQNLVELYLQKKEAATDEEYSEYLISTSETYTKTVRELIESKLIDSGYRTYFYNYPQNSFLYTGDETIVLNAILYAERVQDIENVAKRVSENGSNVIKDAFIRLEQLKLRLPDVVLQTETLYVQALKLYFTGVLERLDSLDYSKDGEEKTLNRYQQLLNFDIKRNVFKSEKASVYCKIWEDKFSETALLQLRKYICKEFPYEIQWYKRLFLGVHSLISETEMEMLKLKDILVLIDFDDDEFSIQEVQYVQQRFSRESIQKDILKNEVEEFYRLSGKILGQDLMAQVYLNHMEMTKVIIPDFEACVFAQILANESAKKDKTEIFQKYQHTINEISSQEPLSNETIKNIVKLDYYEGYTSEVADQLESHGYYFEFVLLLLFQDKEIPFEKPEIKNALYEELECLIEQKYLVPLRKIVTKQPTAIIEYYSFLFGEQCHVMTNEELVEIQRRCENCDELVMNLIPTSLVTEDTAEMLVKFFNRKKQINNLTYAILCYVAKFESSVVGTCFYLLNFDNVRYRYISAERRSKIKQTLASTLSLDTDTGKLAFMEATKYLEASWELALLPTLKDENEKELRKRYVELVNHCENITKATIQVICALPKYYSMSSLVTEKLFEQKLYLHYIPVKVLNDNRKFFIEDGERGDTLWQYYIKIFKHPGWEWLRKCMTNNTEFVNALMVKKEYQGMAAENRMQMCGIYQDTDCLKDVLGYGLDFALRYYLEIGGFLNEEAAEAFVSIVCNEKELLSSNKLYAHTHDMLISGELKRRYTNARKKAGYRGT